MLRKISRWYDEWEQEQLDVLIDPSLASKAAPGYRRFFAENLAALSQLERQELHHFSVTYRGRVLWLALARFALLFSVVGLLLKFAFVPKMNWPVALVLANVIGFCIMMCVFSVWFNYRPVVKKKRTVFLKFFGLGVLGGVVGLIVGAMKAGASWAAILDKLPQALGIVILLVGALFALPVIIVAVLRNQRYETLTAQLQVEAERERMARELSESQLRLLRAQIEPHFLFNTLGAVQQLAEQGAPRAAQLTADLIDFLRASLSDMRAEQACLKAEFRLAESYLRVMQARLGGRLSMRVDLPPELAGVQLPSMTVLTLAENAIKHGIEPALRGGEVAISASEQDGMVRIRVQDSGVGMSAAPGNGMGLQNIRDRLRLAFGSAARLDLHDADPGLVAEIVLPQSNLETAQ
jgi:signal transduction histidine kinase